MSWTKGPWFAVGNVAGQWSVRAPDERVPETGPWEIATVAPCAGYDDDPTEANARLIAAAPELFDLVFRRAQWDDDSPWRREARALIERINGASDAS